MPPFYPYEVNRRGRRMKGSFWPEVRRRMREKAIELYMAEQSKNPYFTEQTPEIEELRESGYLHRAKALVLRDICRGGS